MKILTLTLLYIVAALKKFKTLGDKPSIKYDNYLVSTEYELTNLTTNEKTNSGSIMFLLSTTIKHKYLNFLLKKSDEEHKSEENLLKESFYLTPERQWAFAKVPYY